MLEELKIYKELLNYNELYALVEYVYKNNCEFNINSLAKFFGYAKSKSIPTQILLLNIGIIQENNEKLMLSEKLLQSDFQFNTFKLALCDFFLDSIIEKSESNIIPLDKIKYDTKYGYYIPLSYIKLKYSCIRNFLISIEFFYLDDINNKLLINPIYNETLKKYVSKRRKQISLETLKGILELEERYGKEAELFVLSYEKKRLNDSLLSNCIEIISEIDVTAGYDICSYNTKKSIEHDRYIEVKSYNKKIDFYWSKNEINIAKVYSDKYYLYLVDRDRINDETYTPIIIKNPLKILQSDKYFIEIEKYHIKYIDN
ncbi:DUF3883 domain-containing protein [Clostridium sp. 'White wine YQ']|uniref:DUF3883 domain-containing protein n=1 Tax=Clostridium sp. 'White wine YQ' TaxID=3027474 RepID=UPI00236580BE|nr:DUF3883 domain-containing protein [Clostridium sp. 'White wine YQ']MDD7794355.1 DUF3883 domain-containing protein [Clostridium sp. 'White wine YQ']